VKDSRFPDGWAFFNFMTKGQMVLDVARKMGTVKPGFYSVVRVRFARHRAQ
jgi:hypothetical protein